MPKINYGVRRGLVLCPSSIHPVLVLDKTNAPFLYSEIIGSESPYCPPPQGFPDSRELLVEKESEAYLNALGILHQKVCTLLSTEK